MAWETRPSDHYIVAYKGREDEAREWLRRDVSELYPRVPFEIETRVLAKSSFAGHTVHYVVER